MLLLSDGELADVNTNAVQLGERSSTGISATLLVPGHAPTTPSR